MDPQERSAPLHNHHNHSYPPPQLINNHPYKYTTNNYSNYHHIHMSPNCPVHNRFIQPHTHHHPSCPFSFSPFSSSPPIQLPLMTQGDDQAIFEEEEEEEPVFVLTDEWSDFFAKSDAKRKAVKKQAKKKIKETVES